METDETLQTEPRALESQRGDPGLDAQKSLAEQLLDDQADKEKVADMMSKLQRGFQKKLDAYTSFEQSLIPE